MFVIKIKVEHSSRVLEDKSIEVVYACPYYNCQSKGYLLLMPSSNGLLRLFQPSASLLF